MAPRTIHASSVARRVRSAACGLGTLSALAHLGVRPAACGSGTVSALAPSGSCEADANHCDFNLLHTLARRQKVQELKPSPIHRPPAGRQGGPELKASPIHRPTAGQRHSGRRRRPVHHRTSPSGDINDHEDRRSFDRARRCGLHQRHLWGWSLERPPTPVAARHEHPEVGSLLRRRGGNRRSDEAAGRSQREWLGDGQRGWRCRLLQATAPEPAHRPRTSGRLKPSPIHGPPAGRPVESPASCVPVV